jgi:hypothetical protein
MITPLCPSLLTPGILADSTQPAWQVLHRPARVQLPTPLLDIVELEHFDQPKAGFVSTRRDPALQTSWGEHGDHHTIAGAASERVLLS